MQEAYDFGMILQKLRKQMGWTQEQLANKIQKESSIISRYEKNLQNPTFDTVRSFAAIFNVSMDYLSGTEKSASASTRGLSDSQRDIVNELIDVFRTHNTSPTAVQPTDMYELLGRIVVELASNK